MSIFFFGGRGMGVSGNLGTDRYTLLSQRQEACTRKAACVVLDEEDQPQAGLGTTKRHPWVVVATQRFFMFTPSWGR